MKNTELDYSELIDYLQVEKIIRYGTLSTQTSDLDLVIISDDFESMFVHKRLSVTKKYLKGNRKLDLICLTNDEYRKLKRNPNSFSVNILIKGELLYERRI
ncbi:hypothetical protein [Anaerosalibacter massiliensis]|uniref:Nucleotidyltransferase domain protein n=1 Tax=Anaerosalibacter massiliensis TaxID=1347392 RepID=A0A9X2MHT2_9FIRM|nr:hypothetical protein [Anaerosalibacter massiliensis]MCR2043778.1 hypothetical protein [Anaerosalibacter massiliensis]